MHKLIPYRFSGKICNSDVKICNSKKSHLHNESIEFLTPVPFFSVKYKILMKQWLAQLATDLEVDVLNPSQVIKFNVRR